MLDGIGKDAEIITNDKGGKQSKAVARFDLVDPKCLVTLIKHPLVDPIVEYMVGDIGENVLFQELKRLYPDAILRIARTLEYGVSRYPRNNWRLIPTNDHINHALIHLYADSIGDTQDDHVDHALTRVMMALATDNPDDRYNYFKIEKGV